MLKWIETTGKTEREAINTALKQLGLEDDSVSIEVITRAQNRLSRYWQLPCQDPRDL